MSTLIQGLHLTSIIYESFLTNLQAVYEEPIHMISLGISLVILGTVDYKIRNSSIDCQLNKLPRLLNYVLYSLLIIWLLFAGTFSQPQEFVYFQF